MGTKELLEPMEPPTPGRTVTNLLHGPYWASRTLLTPVSVVYRIPHWLILGPRV